MVESPEVLKDEIPVELPSRGELLAMSMVANRFQTLQRSQSQRLNWAAFLAELKVVPRPLHRDAVALSD
jgi:hypothetical protein